MANVGLHRVAADRLVFSFLKHAEKLHLHARREFADLVEEERSAGCFREAAFASRDRAGERALLVTEELAFEDRLGDRGAVHGDERRIPTRAVLMHVPREELLSGSALAEDEERRARGRRVCRDVEDALQGRTRPHDLARGEHFELLLQHAVFDRELTSLGGFPHGLHHGHALQRLLDEVVGAFAHRLHGGLDRAVGRHEHDLDVGCDLLHRAEELETAHRRHHQIGEDDVDLVAAKELKCRARLRRREDTHPVLLEDLLDRREVRRLVVDDEYGRSVGLEAVRGRNVRGDRHRGPDSSNKCRERFVPGNRNGSAQNETAPGRSEERFAESWMRASLLRIDEARIAQEGRATRLVGEAHARVVGAAVRNEERAGMRCDALAGNEAALGRARVFADLAVQRTIRERVVGAGALHVRQLEEDLVDLENVFVAARFFLALAEGCGDERSAFFDALGEP